MVSTPSASGATGSDGEAGFTLVELLLALVVSMFVVGAAVVLAGQMQTSYRAQFEGATAQQEGRYAIQQIERYLRAAGNNPYRVETTDCPATGTPFQPFRLDPNSDGIHNDITVQMDAEPVNGLIGGSAAAGCPDRNEFMLIALEPIQRTITLRDLNDVSNGARNITDTVIEDLQFVFRNPNRVVTSSPANIAFIETTVTVRSRIRDLSTGITPTYVVRSEIRVRNR